MASIQTQRRSVGANQREYLMNQRQAVTDNGHSITNSASLAAFSPSASLAAAGPAQHGFSLTPTPTVTDTTTNQTYSSIQAAINAANAGDTLVLSAGTFSEATVDVNKALTFEGANAGVDATNGGHTGAESIITNGMIIAAAGVTVDGVEFSGTDTSSTHGADYSSGVYVEASDTTIENSVLQGDANDTRPIAVFGGVNNLDISHNAVTGWGEGVYVVNGDSGSIAHNDFHGDGNGVVTESTTVVISANDFAGNAGADIAPLPFADVDLNSVITGDNTFDGSHVRPITVYANGAGVHEITGTAFSETFIGDYASGPLTVTGGGGNDRIETVAQANYAGNVADYTFGHGTGTDVNGNHVTTLTVTDHNLTNGNEGADALNSVSTLHFADHNVEVVGNGGFATIQDAINAAHDGDTIMVASGTYTEQDTVNGLHGLTIEAMSGAHVTIRAPGSGMTASGVDAVTGREQMSVVTVTDSTDVNIQGITIDGAGQAGQVAGGDNYDGVFYDNASGGLTNVNVIGVRDASLSGVQRGVGVLVSNSAAGAYLDFSMTGGSISDFQKNATVFRHANLDISGVTVTGAGPTSVTAQNGFQAQDSTGSLDGNHVSGIGYTGSVGGAYSGEFLLFDNPNLDVTNNTVTGTNGLDTASHVVGIEVFGSSGAAMGGDITGNIISYTDDGIDVYDNAGNGMTVSGNNVSHLDLTDSGIGIDFEPTTTGNYGVPDNTITSPFNVTGTLYNDILVGGGGNDTLNGGVSGNDSLIGGGGNDTYTARAGVTLVEQANEGVDTVISHGTYTLTDNFENLVLQGANVDGTGNGEDNAITGTAFKNILTGLDGADTLDGGKGSDRLFGGGGADTLISDGTKDHLSGGDGNDTFSFTAMTAKTMATISDFAVGETIDLSALGVHQVAHFDGGANEFRVAQHSGNTYISFDTNHDGHGDHNIVINGGDFSHAGDINFVV